MNAAADSIAPLIARLTQPGAPFELSEVNVSGRMMRAYKNAPATLPDLINAARAHGAKEFIAYQGERWSYDRFFAAADALAGQLQVARNNKPVTGEAAVRDALAAVLDPALTVLAGHALLVG